MHLSRGIGSASFRSSISRPRHPGRACLKVCAESTRVAFQVSKQVQYGESIKLVGSGSALGDWSLDNAPEMSWTDGDIWTVDVDLPTNQTVHFKYVCVNGGGANWEECEDHSVKLPASRVRSDWNGHVDVRGKAEGEKDASNADKTQDRQEQAPNEAPNQNGSTSSGTDERLAHNQWQGADVKFMQSNNHSKERNGQWNTSGLEGAALRIVSADERAASWLAKMEVVKKLLVDEAVDQKPDLDALAAAYVYLQWIGTGAIQCAEGGGHFRPNRHAELSRVIFRSLERVICDPEAAGTRSLLARRMHPKLPSFTEAYTASVPFTRIRDIAHRNDIPHDLKQEIKHTIQNKLHRNAGPEDLVATERLVERLEGEGTHNNDFMDQLRIFRSELRDFFNASSFTDMLQAVRPSLDDSDIPTIDSFLKAKGKVDSAGANASLNDVVDALHTLTSVRAVLSKGLAAGLRNDASGSALAMRQRWRLAEGRSEDYAFVLLSQVTNTLQAQGGSAALAGGHANGWSLPIGAAVLAVRHVGLSGWHPADCAAVENELTAWQQAGQLSERDNALRLKATLERAQRLTQSYTDGLLGVLPPMAEAVGGGLGIRQEQILVFTEAEVRASVVFQLSGLLSVLQGAARIAAGSDAWDAIVGGSGVGELIEADTLEEAEARVKGPSVVVLRQATGDEDVSGCDGALQGLILCHSLPHLSHLGVRARQQGLPFVTVDDEELIAQTIKPLVGKQVQLTSSAAGVQLAAYSPSPSQTPPKSSKSRSTGSRTATSSRSAGASTQVNKATWVPLLEASPETCGAKAASCAALEKASAGKLFETPKGAAIPFGNMELALKAAGQDREFQRLVQDLEKAPRENVSTICDKLQNIVADLRVPDNVLKAVGKHLGATRAYVRSSANVEDLEGMSGAGLYESVPFVDSGSSDDLGAAIALVWASLYTQRATLTRRAAGVSQADASMAVFAMEMLAPDTSFVLHTISPLDRDEAVLHAEIAPGLGETLASGARGTAWRLAVNKSSGETETLAFANFSTALVAPKSSSSSARFQLFPKTVDYSKQPLSRNKEDRQKLGGQLCEVGVALEDLLGGPQDVEGAMLNDRIFVVQSRPQP